MASQAGSVTGWVKKAKGSAKIYRHPGSEFAIVKNQYGARWAGRLYPTVAAAKKATGLI